MNELNIENFTTLKQLNKYLLCLSDKCFIAGGCFKQILSNNKPKDIDIFFKSASAFNTAKRKYDEIYKKSIYENEKCIGYYDKENDVTIDLVRSVYGTPEDICGNFDFTVTKFYYSAYFVGESDVEYKLGCHENFFEHLFLRRLVCDDKILFPASTFERCIRYAKYGFSPCKETKDKLIKALQTSKDTDISKSLYAGID